MGKINWIASYPKSGNTWVRLFVHALHCLKEGETEFFRIDGARLNPTFFQDSERVVCEPHLSMDWKVADKDAMAKSRPLAQRAVASGLPGILTGKTHNALISVNGVPTIAEDATNAVIYIIRHPYDIAVSLKDHYGTKDYDDAIDIMNFDDMVIPKSDRFIDIPTGSWRQNVASWTQKPRRNFLIVRYEDMLTEPEPVFRAIMRAYGYDENLEMLRQALDLTRFDRLREEEVESGFKEKSEKSDTFFKRGTAGYGRKILSQRQLRKIAKFNEPVMKRLGYTV